VAFAAKYAPIEDTAMTIVQSPPDFSHFVQVVAVRGFGHRAECLCGWASVCHEDKTFAELAAVEHREQAMGPPTGLDILLAGLIDMQDDVADALMWFAENWSSDLPTPRVIGRVHQRDDGECAPGLGLVVRCVRADDFSRVATALGLQVDHDPDRARDVRQRASRSFGSVLVVAYHDVPTAADGRDVSA
jgi:hypothetical protein